MKIVSFFKRMSKDEWERFYEENQEWNLFSKIMGESDFKVRRSPRYYYKAIMVQGEDIHPYAGQAFGDLCIAKSNNPGVPFTEDPKVILNFVVPLKYSGLEKKMEQLGFLPIGEVIQF